MTSQDITSTGPAAARAVIDRMTRALGGRLPLESAATEMITATGWRRHSGWGTEPSKPEAAADFTYTLVNDLSGARYRLELRGRTYLVPAALDYIEKGNGSAGQLTGGADVTLEDGEAGGAPTQVLVLREPGRPATRVHVEVSTGLPDGSAAQMAFSQYSTQWILTCVYAGVRFYFDLQTAPVTRGPAELAPGVKIVLGASHNTLVVEMPDHTLAVEAPLYDEYTRAAVPFAEAIFAAPHTTDPDRYAARLRPVTVRPVTESVILPTADGAELRIYRIPSDHADDMVIVYLSGPKIVFESDLWNPTPSMPEPGAQRGRLATQLYQAITDLGLDVETVVGGHRGTDGTTLTHAAPLSYLETAAGL